ncbi:Dehydrogenase aclE [Psilocybe cubensis]|uniref:Dehydrogenase aclE n=2 Tax=Psilocybe cubensis TaxID=181762 RepID=A0ACB8GPT5_PSICU|nr:Dehydrogenase aclE [Psilocybe cubensis]KAH9477571.1 Dehydrogenase aclE [Psilocybe cubensis]
MTSSDSSNQKIRVGFIGLSASSGWAAGNLAPALLHPSLRDRFDLVAVSTTTDTSAAASAAKYSKEVGHDIKAYSGDTSRIAADPDIDLVAVSVKAPNHLQAVLPVIEAGKNFFLEWPAGASTRETEMIAEAARRNGVRSIIGLQGRHAVVIRKLREILASGVIGTVRSTNVITHNPRELGYYAPFAREVYAYSLDPKNGCSLLAIPIAHQLDTLVDVLGEFASVSATEATMYPTITFVDEAGKPTDKTIPSRQPDHYAITGILKTGVLANILWRSGYASSEGRRQFIWEIEGEEGSIILQSKEKTGAFPGFTESELYLNGQKVEFETPGNVFESCRQAWQEYADGTERYVTIDDAVKHHRLIDAIETSAKEGRRIVL